LQVIAFADGEKLFWSHGGMQQPVLDAHEQPTLMNAASAAILKGDVEITMAITIRNKQLEAEIKALGAKYRKGPTETVRFLNRDSEVSSA
jgi:hypothetical protein